MKQVPNITEFYGNNVEVICESDIQIQPEELFKLNEKAPFWQQIKGKEDE